ncbi:right-handed parallel beta-helix repeat-containing protein [Geobacter grbiciae]|uniref:right-handed parallel beta-helix repeat-containing protein n=1 Tax=Geobacter grbiciae TaxID=155042 RepID=UPI001C010F65|nr:right-handed parallel beta-helix repeat-containing protein [Geobacter grbiciae]MBT1075372.1 right-handed parallel beta-helix repeat-containing protein [Geobacter grbiciae]
MTISLSRTAFVCTVPILALLVLLAPRSASAGVITADTVWAGSVTLTEDVLVPEGVTLTVRPGTSITVVAAESTKTDPEYLSPLNEITVRGTLTVEGTEKAPVRFSGAEKKKGSWAGILVDGGTAAIRGCRISDADTGVSVTDGTLRLTGSALLENRYGLVVQGTTARVAVADSRITGNDYGIFTLQGARVATSATEVARNGKKDTYAATFRGQIPPKAQPVNDGAPVGRRYRDMVILGETVWQGRIEIDGTVRVPEGSRLVILPGTIVEFTRRDTNGDGIGENGIMIQGRLVAKGTAERPITFRSAAKGRRMGDWDAVNIMNSSTGQNLIEYCRIEDAYRGLHFHFSTVAIHNTTLTGNYRGIQFQESVVVMRGNTLCGNRSGVQGRDSEVELTDNLICTNQVGGNFFRTTLTAQGNRIVANGREGLRVREGAATLRENHIDGNRFGLLVADLYHGEVSRNGITNNTETGISLKNVDTIDIVGNVVAGNGLNGFNIQDCGALITGNLVTGNGERGMGIQSFAGRITGNDFGGNGLYAIDLDGKDDVAAPGNWWGGDDPARVVFDRHDDPALGLVHYDTASASPIPFVWPLPFVATDAVWRGVITVAAPTTVLPGAVLTVAPGTTVRFAGGTGLEVKGKLIAAGKRDSRIVFTSVERKGASDWNEILLEYATGSVIAHCLVEYATWGIHSHFTDLSVTDSVIAHNYGGMRFRSGPVQIRRSLFRDNTIGIRSYIGNALIADNLITGNETGIFVREKGGGLTVTGNSISGNSGYNMRIGDFNDEDVNARGNWWGEGDPGETIFDGRQEPGIGMVLFEPHLTKPPAVGPGSGETP